MTTFEIPLRRVLVQGSRGDDVRAVRRTLARSGYGRLSNVTDRLTAVAAQDLRNYQHDQSLRADGKYGPVTHARLVERFDRKALNLYLTSGEEPLQLSAAFKPTHQTAGLSGYGADAEFADH